MTREELIDIINSEEYKEYINWIEAKDPVGIAKLYYPNCINNRHARRARKAAERKNKQ